jgi:putative heme-binding domain-containing protein
VVPHGDILVSPAIARTARRRQTAARFRIRGAGSGVAILLTPATSRSSEMPTTLAVRACVRGMGNYDKSTSNVISTNVSDACNLRRDLERIHHNAGAEAVDFAWPHLNHSDRFVRFAARIAIEHQPAELWQSRLLTETDPQSLLTGAVALARCGDGKISGPLLKALGQISFSQLNRQQQLELLRAYSLVFIRMDKPDNAVRHRLASRLLNVYPAFDINLDRELSRMLAYLKADGVVTKTLDLIDSSELKEDQIHFASVLRTIDAGWSPRQRMRYFEWFVKARSYAGGQSIQGFVNRIREDAVSTLSDSEKDDLAGLFKKLAEVSDEAPLIEPRPIVKKWTVGELAPDRTADWKSFFRRKPNIQRGRRMFTTAACIACHRTGGRGGMVGPDLAGATRRFSPHDLLEAIIEPSKTIPHQFQAVTVLTNDGKVVVGEIVNLSGGTISVRTNPLDPSKLTKIKQDEIEDVTPSKTSLMPAGLLDTLKKEEVFDLLGYLASGESTLR